MKAPPLVGYIPILYDVVRTIRALYNRYLSVLKNIIHEYEYKFHSAYN
jgi:hypothetical protein